MCRALSVFAADGSTTRFIGIRLYGTSRSALTLKVFFKIASRIELPCIFRVARWAYAYMSRSRPSPLSLRSPLKPKSKSSLDIKTQPPIYHATRKPIIDVLAPEVTRTLTYLD